MKKASFPIAQTEGRSLIVDGWDVTDLLPHLASVGPFFARKTEFKDLYGIGTFTAWTITHGPTGYACGVRGKTIRAACAAITRTADEFERATASLPRIAAE
jgi:hypothetical protein